MAIRAGEHRCPECGLVVEAEHTSGGLICRMLAVERFQKHRE